MGARGAQGPPGPPGARVSLLLCQMESQLNYLACLHWESRAILGYEVLMALLGSREVRESVVYLERRELVEQLGLE